MNRLQYLLDVYETNDLEILHCRMPYDFTDSRFNNMTDEDFIAMVERVEELENESIYNMIKERI